MKPLAGIKVLDFTQFFAGPLCTMYLAELGADVIKFENPNIGGDNTRYTKEIVNGKSSNYSAKNLGKKSVLMDLKDPRQKEIFLEMVKTADVVVENFKPGTMEKFGLTYEVLSEINPKIVLTSISGFGQNGPYRDRPAYDGVVQAESGFMSLTGLNDVPTQSGPPIADAVAGLNGCIGTLSALLDAKMNGKGRRVDVALMDSLLVTFENLLPSYLVNGIVPKPVGNRHPNATPFQPVTLKDGELYICIATDDQWQKFSDIFGHAEWGTDPRFVTMVKRRENRDELLAMIGALLKEMEVAKFSEEMMKRGLIFGTINNLQQVVEHPQTKARNMIATAQYPDGTELKVAACPIKMSGMEEETEYKVPDLGYHTIEVLSEYASAELVHEIYDPILEKAIALNKKKTGG